MRNDFSVFNIKDLTNERPLLISEKHLQLYTFTGTKINRTIHLLLKLLGVSNNFDERDPSSCFTINTSAEALKTALANSHNILNGIDDSIKQTIEEGSLTLDSKWGHLLPIDYQINLIKQKYYDIESAIKFLELIKLKTNIHPIN